MTLYSLRLPFSVDPLMAEAKGRARKRRVLLSAVGLVGVAFAVVLFFAFGGGGSGNGQSGGAAGSRGIPTPAVGQFASLTVHGPVYFVSGDGITKPPGGAELRHERKLVGEPTLVGPAAIWVAPDWAVHGSCAWLTIGRAVDGGECRHSPPPAGLWEVVPIRQRIGGGFVTLIWGHAGRKVSSLKVRFQDGTTTRLRLTESVFFHVFPAQRWRLGHRPALLIVREKNGRTLHMRLISSRLAR